MSIPYVLMAQNRAHFQAIFVILDKADYARSLDRKSKATDVADLLKPFEAGKVETWPASTYVTERSISIRTFHKGDIRWIMP